MLIIIINIKIYKNIFISYNIIMYEAIIITTFFSIWSVERLYYFFYNNNNSEPVLNLNTPIMPYSINNSTSQTSALSHINPMSRPLSNSTEAYYYTAPVYNMEHNNSTSNSTSNTPRNSINNSNIL